MKYVFMLALLLSSVEMHAVAAETEPVRQPDYTYYGFEPEIVTNYISTRKKLGFVRVGVELMVKKPDELLLLQRHEPLLRAAVIEILGNQVEDKIKSIAGRDDIRHECLSAINQLLQAETGNAPVVNLLFTRYLYD